MTTTTINQKLQMTSEEYDDMIFGAYSRWCESVTTNAHEFQKVLANSSISKWFMMEWAKCETEFEQLTGRYEGSNGVTPKDYKTCYNGCTFRMFNIRPMALLNDIKKKTAVTATRINGIKIHSLNFNLN